MIDVSKCEFEELHKNPEYEETVYYFLYPKCLDETEFYSEEDYGNVVGMCISLTVNDNGDYYVAMSPTVDEGDCLFDVDWRDLYEGINYSEDTVRFLLNMANKASKGE